MEILEIELWDPLVEFRRDLRDAQFYQQVIELLIVYSVDWRYPIICISFNFISSLYWTQIDRDGSGYIELSELKQALDLCGFKIPSYEVRRMVEEVDRDQRGPGKGRLSFDEFEHVRIHSPILFFYRFTKIFESWQGFLFFGFFLCGFQLCAKLKSQDVAATFKKVVSKPENLHTIGGTSNASSEGTTHTVKKKKKKNRMIDFWSFDFKDSEPLRLFFFRFEWRNS